ncbi:MAG TPA: hypothetical protein VJZ76_15955 [Thermoanaerobaculia bacterium]|nr:hypothetical protein [Thermoanaerobaculia bacterium]
MSVRTCLSITAVLFLLIQPVYAGRKPPDEQSAASVAKTYVQQHRATLGLVSDELEARQSRTERATIWTVVRFDVYYRGIQIWPCEIVVTVTQNGVANALGAKVPSDFAVTTTPKVSQAAAIDAAVRQMSPKAGFDPPDAQLIILRRNADDSGTPATTRLAWRIEIYTSNDVDGTEYRYYWVDAQTGAILKNFKRETNATALYVYQPTQRGMYTASSVFQVATLNRDHTIKTAYLQDPCYGNSVAYNGICGTPDASNGYYTLAVPGNWVGDAGYHNSDRGRPMRKSSRVDVWGDGILGSANAETPGADAFFAMTVTFDFLRYRFGREGLDGQNGPKRRF